MAELCPPVGGGGGVDVSSDPSPLVSRMEGFSHTIPMAAVVPNVGFIRINEVLAAIDECIDEMLILLSKSGMPDSSYRVVAIGFTTFVMNLVGVDTYGNPVGDAATCSYACNRDDVVKECKTLRDKLGPKKVNAIYRRTGSPIHVSYALPQLLAFYRNPDNQGIAKQIDKWQTISSICLQRWSGRYGIQMPISFSEASWTGMLNFRTCHWDDLAVDLLETCDGVVQYSIAREENWEEVDDEIDLLPPMVDFDAALPFLREGIPRYNDTGSINSYWERWPKLRSTVNLFYGVGDGAAANIGSKCSANSSSSLNSHRIAVTIGTSAAARVCLYLPMSASFDTDENDILVPPGLFCYRVHRDLVLLGGALTDGGSVIEWSRSLLNLQRDDLFSACLEKASQKYEKNCTSAPSEPKKVAMIPFLSGERSVGFRSGARGCIAGLTRETTPVDITYACLESVILRLGCVLQLMKEKYLSQPIEGNAPSRSIIVASGNALERNALWRKMLADCSSMDVVIDGDASEGASRGVAVLVAGSLHQAGLGMSMTTFRSTDEPLVVANVTKSNLASEKHWRTAMSAQESLIDCLYPLNSI